MNNPANEPERRHILHLDMDAFYASVEELDNPSLRGKPVIVGGTSDRGVVSAASYAARRFGVHSAMPIFMARKKCPQGIFLPVRMERYKELSERIMKLLQTFTPVLEQVSIDEAFLDVSGMENIAGSLSEMGTRIKARIKRETGLTCSIGIAPTKFLAKIASDLNKPDGMTIINHKDMPAFIKGLPVEKVPGVGEKALGKLRKLGIHRLGDVKRFPEETLNKRIGKFGKRLFKLARGIDDSPVRPFSETKSISSEETLSSDTSDMAFLKKQLLRQAERVGRRLRKKHLKGWTVTLKLKRANFSIITRQTTLDQATRSSQTIFEHGVKLLEQVATSSKYRLIGVGVTNLVLEGEQPVQMNLFEKRDPKEQSWEEVEEAMDRIKNRFGGDAIKRGGLLPPDE